MTEMVPSEGSGGLKLNPVRFRPLISPCEIRKIHCCSLQLVSPVVVKCSLIEGMGKKTSISDPPAPGSGWVWV